MANNAYNTVDDCPGGAAPGTRGRHHKQVPLTPAAGPLEFLAMDILDPFSKTESGNQDVFVLTD